MSPEQENFHALRRLIALKRHEQPPPGFFEDFSHRVLVRIKTGDRGEEAHAFGSLFSEAPWLQRLVSALTTNPTLAGAFGLTVSCLLVAGVVYSSNSGASGSQQTVQELTADPGLTLQFAGQSSGFVSSTNGFMPEPSQPSLFDEYHHSQTQPVSALANASAH